MSYAPVEVFRKEIRFLGIPIWTVIKTISQEKFYELISATVLREIDQKFMKIDQRVSENVLKKINSEFGAVINERFSGKKS